MSTYKLEDGRWIIIDSMTASRIPSHAHLGGPWLSLPPEVWRIEISPSVYEVEEIIKRLKK